jgi:hypothetical protein
VEVFRTIIWCHKYVCDLLNIHLICSTLTNAQKTSIWPSYELTPKQENFSTWILESDLHKPVQYSSNWLHTSQFSLVENWLPAIWKVWMEKHTRKQVCSFDYRMRSWWWSIDRRASDPLVQKMWKSIPVCWIKGTRAQKNLGFRTHMILKSCQASHN